MSADLPWLVWSNEHRQWWGPNWRGYTGILEQAGRYPKEVAERICREANHGGEINEVAILAPEAVDVLKGMIAARERGEMVEIVL